jgi:hypothetical protein
MTEDATSEKDPVIHLNGLRLKIEAKMHGQK